MTDQRTESTDESILGSIVRITETVSMLENEQTTPSVATECPYCLAGRPEENGWHRVERTNVRCRKPSCRCNNILTREQYAESIDRHQAAEKAELLSRYDMAAPLYGPLCLNGCGRKSWPVERRMELRDAVAYEIFEEERVRRERG